MKAGYQFDSVPKPGYAFSEIKVAPTLDGEKVDLRKWVEHASKRDIAELRFAYSEAESRNYLQTHLAPNLD